MSALRLPMSSVEHELQTHAAALRRLARDLVGSTDADDLVQETALRALRSPPQLPGGLGGFLATILRRLAGTHWREQRRRQRREQAAAPPEPVPAPDQALVRGETLQLLTAAVMVLPQAYREVLLQRYFEGLRPAAIARHLDVPVATVKTRLQRGLQQLRERLDADRERSAWRGTLAGAFGLGPLATGLTGAFVMGTGTKLAIGGAAALLATVAWVAMPDEPGTAMATLSTDAGSAQSVIAAGETRQVAPTAESPILREEVQTEPASPDVRVTIRGRCVDAASKAPLSGCRVSVSASSLPAPAAPVVTGPDGCLQFTFAPLAKGNVTVECRVEGRLRRNAYLGELPAERVVDLGDIEMALGAHVHGRVIGPDGQPVADCRLGIAGLAIALRSTNRPELIRAGSKADGTFAFDDPVPPGNWPLEQVGRAGWAHVSPRSITVPDGATTVEVVVICAPTPFISGSVVDAEGRPIAKAELRPVLERSGPYPSAASKADGSFELFALETDPQPQRLELYQATGFELPPRTEPIAWGSRNVSFVLQRGVSIDVEVVERASQHPVEEFAATAPKAQGPFPSRAWPTAPREQGRIRLDGLERGRHIVAVLPKDPMLLQSQVMVDVQQGIAPVRIEVERMSPQQVIVRDAGGEPIAGAAVEVRHLAMDPSLERLPLDFRRQWPRVNELRLAEHIAAVLYWRAETDARGETTVGIPGNDDRVAVRVSCRGRSPLTVRNPTLIPGQPLILTLHEAAGLQGRVRVAGYPGRTFLVLSPDAVSDVMTRVDLAADGSFRVEDLEPGPRVLRWGLELSGSTWPLDPPLQEVVLRSGETATLDLDASRFDAGTVKGTIVIDGQRLNGGRVDVFVKLSRPGRSLGTSFGPFVVDGGVFTAIGVLPGKCTVRMRIEDQGHESWLAHEDEVVVSAGGTVQREFHFVRRQLKVRVLDSQGGPLAGRRIWAVPPTQQSRMAKTDAEGRAVFDWMPAGKVMLSQKPRDPLAESLGATRQPVRPGEGDLVEIPVGQGETTVDVRWQ